MLIWANFVPFKKANAESGPVYECAEHADLSSATAAAATTAALHESAAATSYEPKPAALRSTRRPAEVLDAAGHATELDEPDGPAELGHAVQQFTANAARNGAPRSAE